MPTSSQKFSKGYAGKKKKPDASAARRQSGGTSGDLSIPGYKPETPVTWAPPSSPYFVPPQLRGDQAIASNGAPDPANAISPSEMAAILLGEHVESSAPGANALAELLNAPSPALPDLPELTGNPAKDVLSTRKRSPDQLKPKGLQPNAIASKVSELAELTLNPEDAAAIARASKRYSVDPALLTSIYQIETGFGQNEGPSSAGAVGKMQFMPETWETYGEGKDPSDVNAAMDAAARYLVAAGYKKGDRAAEDDAIYAYNHADWYVDEVQEGADKFRPVWGSAGNVGSYDNPLAFEGSPSDVRTAGDVIPHKKLFKWLEGAGGNTANRENIANLNPVFARHLLRAAIKSGDPLLITSAQRMEEEQAEIDPGTNPAAPPGYSVHQFGGAADTEPTPEQIKLLEEEGIEHGYAGGEPDPPHTEFTDPRLIKRMTRFGPVRSGYAPPGLEEAVGDITGWSSDGVSSGGAAAPSSSLGSLGTAMVSPTSTSGYSGSDNPILNAALNRTSQAPDMGGSSLSDVLGFLDSPAPEIGKPLQPLQMDDDLLKLALRRRV